MSFNLAPELPQAFLGFWIPLLPSGNVITGIHKVPAQIPSEKLLLDIFKLGNQ